jgi:hypothetical protein
LEGIGKDISNLIQPDGNGRNEERQQHLDIGPPQIHDDSSAAENPDEDDEEEEDDDDEDDDGGDVYRPDTNDSIGSQSQHNSIDDITSQSDEDMVVVDANEAAAQEASNMCPKKAMMTYSKFKFIQFRYLILADN